MIWKEKRVLLAVLALLLLANAAFFFTYRVQYESRLQDLESRREEATRILKGARTARMGAEQQLAAYQQVRKDVDSIYRDRWSTQEERLAPLIIEVKRLANASDLIPGGYSFSRTEAKGVKQSSSKEAPGATMVRIDFSVQGTYEQVRRLINLLELSDQFVIIDELSLSSTSGNVLSLNIGVLTLFREDAGTGSTPAATAPATTSATPGQKS